MTKKRKTTQPEGFALKEIKPKTKNQEAYFDAIHANQITFCVGPAGCGKTAIATALGCRYLVHGQVERLILTRPVIETGKGIGFLPGDMKEKTREIMIPILDELNSYLGPVVVQRLINEEKIQIAPLCFMRGRNFHNCYCICDEMENATIEEMKLLLTRIGMNTKMVINGDIKQSDLPVQGRGALEHCIDKLRDIEDIAIVKLYAYDIQRNPIIGKILERI